MATIPESDVAELQAARIDLPRDQACTQDVGHLLQLEFAGGGLLDGGIVQFEAGDHALEVEARGQFAVGLVHGIGEFVGVHFGNDVE